MASLRLAPVAWLFPLARVGATWTLLIKNRADWLRWKWRRLRDKKKFKY